MSLPPSVVIDNGTDSIKSGFAGEEYPCLTFENSIRKINIQSNEQYNSFPIEEGVISNWDDMECQWNFIFDKLNTASSAQPCLLTDIPTNPKQNKQKMTEMMFETFEVPSLYLANHSVLSLYATGRTTGLIIDSGHGTTHIVPIYDGYQLKNSVIRMNLAGINLNSILQKELEKSSIQVCNNFIPFIKQKYCYIAENYELELYNKNEPVQCQLPDGNTFLLDNIRYKIGELMVNPSSFGYPDDGIALLIKQAIDSCDLDLQQTMNGNIILSGGNSMLRGMQQRLGKEYNKLIEDFFYFFLYDSCQATNNCWTGGSIIGYQMPPLFITKSEYDEEGPQIVFKKCFL